MSEKQLYWVKIACNQCDERFQLKGKLTKGKVETGFKRCFCDNETDFIIDEQLIKVQC